MDNEAVYEQLDLQLRKPEVLYELEKLKEGVELIRCAAAKVKLAVSPVLVQPTYCGELADTRTPPPLTALGKELRTVRDEAKEAEHVLAEILERIEL